MMRQLAIIGAAWMLLTVPATVFAVLAARWIYQVDQRLQQLLKKEAERN